MSKIFKLIAMLALVIAVLFGAPKAQAKLYTNFPNGIGVGFSTSSTQNYVVLTGTAVTDRAIPIFDVRNGDGFSIVPSTGAITTGPYFGTATGLTATSALICPTASGATISFTVQTNVPPCYGSGLFLDLKLHASTTFTYAQAISIVANAYVSNPNALTATTEYYGVIFNPGTWTAQTVIDAPLSNTQVAAVAQPGSIITWHVTVNSTIANSEITEIKQKYDPFCFQP